MAIEALRQGYEIEGLSLEGVTLRDVIIKTALVIPENNDGVEVILHLQTATDGSRWSSFTVESLADNIWTSHCEGRIAVTQKPPTRRETPVILSTLTQRVSGKRWYNAFNRVGFYYGKTFQQLRSVRTDRNLYQACGNVTVKESSDIMQGESRYLIHPSTVDACLQLIIVSIHAGKHREMPWGVVPTRIEEISIFPTGQQAGTIGHASAWIDDRDQRKFNTNVSLTASDGRTLVDVKNLTCITYDAAIPAISLEQKEIDPEPLSIVSWKPDVLTLTTDSFDRLWPSVSLSKVDRLCKILQFITHRQHVSKVLVCGSPAPQTVEGVLRVLPEHMYVTLGYDGEQELHLSNEAMARTIVKTLPEHTEDWRKAIGDPFDLVLVDYSSHHPEYDTEALTPLLKDHGWLLGFTQQFAALPTNALKLGEAFLIFNTGTREITNGTTIESVKISILSWQDDLFLNKMISTSAFGVDFHESSIKHFSPNQQSRIVIDDTSGTLMSTMTTDTEIYESVKQILTSSACILWLTRGVKQGLSAPAGMGEGFLRAIRSEQAAARIVLLDIDYEEKPDDVCKAIMSKLDTVVTKDSGLDTEFWLHNGCLHISRVYPHADLNKDDNQAETKVLPKGGLLKAISDSSQIIFESCLRQRQLSKEEVEIQVLASEMQSSTSGSRLLACGNVLRTGSSVDQALIGRRVVAVTSHELATVVYSSIYVALDEDEPSSAEILLSDLLPLQPAINLCLFRHAMVRGDFLLVLPSPKPFTTAIARLSNAMDWNLHLVVESHEEKQQLLAQHDCRPEQVLLTKDFEDILTLIRNECKESLSGAVDVIAYEFDPWTQELWRCIPAFCRLRVSNNSSEAAPDPLPFKRGASFLSPNVRSLYTSPKATKALLDLSLQLLKTHRDVFMGHIDSWLEIVDVADAHHPISHSESHNEASVIRFNYDRSSVKVQ